MFLKLLCHNKIGQTVGQKSTNWLRGIQYNYVNGTATVERRGGIGLLRVGIKKLFC